MSNIQDRINALEAVLQQKVNLIQQLDTKKNDVVTEVVKIQGKLELLKELSLESSEKPSIEEKKEDLK